MGCFKFSKFSLLFSICLLFSGYGYGENSTQIAALLAFKAGIFADPENALESWNSSGAHACNWLGVHCHKKTGKIVEIVLSHYSLEGIISPSISNLSDLEVLDLSQNIFQGNIPKEIGLLSNLKQLSLSSNLLQGNIPSELGTLHQLVYLDLGSNNFSGEIPKSLLCNVSSSVSSALQYLDLSNNSLGGEIPVKNECFLEDLKFLLLWSNQLVGEVPPALANSTRLEWIDLESNLLSGELPDQIVYRMPRLQFLYLSYNSFKSHCGNADLEPFFASLTNSSNLQELELAGNGLGGKLPSIIGDLSVNLVQIHLDDNQIYGPIPPEISNLENLTLLNLSSNLLNGSIPSKLCQIHKLERLYLANNLLSGNIPPAFGNALHLGLLDLSKNNLSGTIPDSFANLSQLRRLLLYENRLSGTIPPSLGKCINLEILDLAHNRIAGMIPGDVAGLSSLKLYLNLSSNLLHGPIPLELSKMDMVLAIDLSSNNLSGTIPSQLGSCIALEYLNLSSNILKGNFPASVGRLPYLKALDVSVNQLTGEIPDSLWRSMMLATLNFSYNNFFGNVTNEGAFSSLTVGSFLGNPGLCGSVRGMPRCHRKRTRHFVMAILVSLIVTAIFFMVGYPLLLKFKFRRHLRVNTPNDEESEEKAKKELKLLRISHQQLIEATGGFTGSSLIGSGQFGQVYKGVLEDNTRIAVKVLNSKAAGELLSHSFKRECEVLRRTRHRNLIRIITICSRPDFKALVLPLMPNGSLENHLYPDHGSKHGLDLVQLVSICSDVAAGMAYLHHHSPVRVVHCDLKPSNILLDADMTAFVTDFGISRLIKGTDEDVSPNDSTSFSSTDGLLCGSVGYIAPEYGMGKRASTQGDVYSFGVLLLEIVSGRRPTNVLCQEGSNLHEWIKSFYPHNLQPIVEEAMARFSPGARPVTDDQRKRWRDVILEMIELGLICTQYNPSTRPTMLDIAHEIGLLKQYLACSSSQLNEEAPIELRNPSA